MIPNRQSALVMLAFKLEAQEDSVMRQQGTLASHLSFSHFLGSRASGHQLRCMLRPTFYQMPLLLRLAHKSVSIHFRVIEGKLQEVDGPSRPLATFALVP